MLRISEDNDKLSKGIKLRVPDAGIMVNMPGLEKAPRLAELLLEKCMANSKEKKGCRGVLELSDTPSPGRRRIKEEKRLPVFRSRNKFYELLVKGIRAMLRKEPWKGMMRTNSQIMGGRITPAAFEVWKDYNNIVLRLK